MSVSVNLRAVCVRPPSSKQAYSSILNATLSLLSCVSVPGAAGKFLFQDATRSCTRASWQAPLFIVVVFVVGFALTLPLVTYRVHRKRIAGNGIHRVLCEGYKPRFYYWESVLIGVASVTAPLTLPLSLSFS